MMAMRVPVRMSRPIESTTLKTESRRPEMIQPTSATMPHPTIGTPTNRSTIRTQSKFG